MKTNITLAMMLLVLLSACISNPPAGLIVWQKSLPQVRALDVFETSAGDFILAGDLHWIKFDSQGITNLVC
jgi:hypothetical protein